MDTNAEAQSIAVASESAATARDDDPAPSGMEAGPGEQDQSTLKAITGPRDSNLAADESDNERAPALPIGQLKLVPFFETRSEEAVAKSTAKKARFGAPAVGVAAGLSLLVIFGAAGIYERSRQIALIVAKTQENQALASSFDQLKERIDAIDAARARDETADLHKVLNEIRAETSQVHELNASLAQLSTRVDHVEHDEGARIDKLAERIDRDSSARYADLASRLEKLEKKASTPAPVIASVPAAPKQIPAASKVNPPISNETTGAIERPRLVLRGYAVVDVHDGFAEIEGRDGPQTVGPGDFIPGAGRVQRVERHGRDWAVITNLGVIEGDGSMY